MESLSVKCGISWPYLTSQCLVADLEETFEGLKDRNKYMTSGTYTMSSKGIDIVDVANH